MTDHEMLELLVQKVTGLEHKITGLDHLGQTVTGLDQKVSGMDQKLSGLDQKVSGIEKDVKFIKVQQSEHGEMIQSLVHSSQIQKAQHDALQMAVAKLSGEMRQEFSDLA